MSEPEHYAAITVVPSHFPSPEHVCPSFEKFDLLTHAEALPVAAEPKNVVVKTIPFKRVVSRLIVSLKANVLLVPSVTEAK